MHLGFTHSDMGTGNKSKTAFTCHPPSMVQIRANKGPSAAWAFPGARQHALTPTLSSAHHTGQLALIFLSALPHKTRPRSTHYQGQRKNHVIISTAAEKAFNIDSYIFMRISIYKPWVQSLQLKENNYPSASGPCHHPASPESTPSHTDSLITDQSSKLSGPTALSGITFLQ